MRRGIVGIIVSAALFAASGGEDPGARARAFVPTWIAGKIRTKPMDTPDTRVVSDDGTPDPRKPGCFRMP